MGTDLPQILYTLVDAQSLVSNEVVHF
jgi:hypothetical protein